AGFQLLATYESPHDVEVRALVGRQELEAGRLEIACWRRGVGRAGAELVSEDHLDCPRIRGTEDAYRRERPPSPRVSTCFVLGLGQQLLDGERPASDHEHG